MIKRRCVSMQIASFIILAVTCFSGCGAYATSAEKILDPEITPSLIDIAPADALLAIQIKDVAEAFALIEDSRAWQQLLEAPVWELLWAVFEKEAGVKDFHHLVRPGLSILSHVLGQEILLVVPKFSELPEISPTLMLKLDQSDDLGEILSSAIKVAIANIPEAKPREYSGYSYMTAEIRPDLSLSCGLVDNFLIVSLREVPIRRMIDLYQGKSDASLAKDSNFSHIIGQLEGSPGDNITNFQTIYYLDLMFLPELVELIYPKFRGEIGEETQPLADEAIKWLDLVQSVGSVTNLTKDGMVSRSYIELNPNATANNFRDMLLAEPTPHDSIKFATTDAISYSSFNMVDLPKLWRMAMDFVESMPPEMSGEVLGGLQQVETMINLDIEEGLFSWMGNEIALVQTEVTMLSPGVGGDTTPQFLLSIQTTDSAKAAKNLEQLTDSVAEWEIVDHAGSQIRTAALPRAPYQPSYVVTEQYVLISSRLADLKLALDCARGTVNNLSTETQFKELRGLAPEGVNYIAYANLARLLEQTVDTVVEQTPAILESMVSEMESELIQSMLPSTIDFVREIAKTLGGQIQYTVKDGDDLRSYSFLKMRDIDLNFEWADPPEAKSIRWLLMARIYAEQGMRNRALTYLNRVLAIDPNRPDALRMKKSLLEDENYGGKSYPPTAQEDENLDHEVTGPVHKDPLIVRFGLGKSAKEVTLYRVRENELLFTLGFPGKEPELVYRGPILAEVRGIDTLWDEGGDVDNLATLAPAVADEAGGFAPSNGEREITAAAIAKAANSPDSHGFISLDFMTGLVGQAVYIFRTAGKEYTISWTWGRPISVPEDELADYESYNLSVSPE